MTATMTSAMRKQLDQDVVDVARVENSIIATVNEVLGADLRLGWPLVRVAWPRGTEVIHAGEEYSIGIYVCSMDDDWRDPLMTDAQAEALMDHIQWWSGDVIEDGWVERRRGLELSFDEVDFSGWGVYLEAHVKLLTWVEVPTLVHEPGVSCLPWRACPLCEALMNEGDVVPEPQADLFGGV